jgi:hypothetical protein
MTKQIPLSQQKRRNSKNLGLVALVDDEDYDWLCQWKWTSVSTERRNGGYAMRLDNRAGKTILMHRIILNAPEGVEVDHINGSGLDNRRENLRIVTLQQNRQNRSRGRNNQTGYKGVTFDKKSGKWSRSFRVLFDSAEEAAKVYDQLARIVYGEHANTNFPESDTIRLNAP